MTKTGTRLSAALLGYFTLIILLLTLNPFYLAEPDRINFAFHSSMKDLISNILLFIPLGFFYRLTTKQRGAILLGAVLSFSIETMQLFIPVRTPSIIDILANTLSAGLGAILHDVISTRLVISQDTVARLRLETPLMGLIYLLLPLLWANTLNLSNSPDRWLLTTLIGISGAIVLSELFRHWWHVVDYRISGYASFAAGVWFFLGAGPALIQQISLLAIGLGVMFLAAILTSRPKRSSERRFEQTTLKRMFPVFMLYIILLAFWEPTRPLTAWHWALGFTDKIAETSMQGLIPRIEYLVSFTVLGYLFAEWRGRSETPLIQDLPRLFLISIGFALALEFFVGFQIGPGTSLIRMAVAVISALFGGSIYHLLRAHIRFLLN
jgi:glycopeptide antibiotics resistance protein